MKAFGKRILAVTLVLSLIFVTACSKKSEDTSGDSQATDSTKGRYLEEDITIPDEVGNYIIDLVELEDGTYRLISENGIFDSGDEGQSWSSLEQTASLLSEGKSISAGALSKSGEILAVLYDYSQMSQESGDENSISGSGKIAELNTEYYFYDKDGNETKLEITLPESETFSKSVQSMEPGKGSSVLVDGATQAMEQELITESVDESTGESDSSSLEETNQGSNQELETSNSGIVSEGNGSSPIMIGSSSSSLNDVMLAPNGDILGIAGIGTLYIIDSATGEIKHTIPAEDSIIDYVCVGERIIISYNSAGIETYDLLTGELIDTDKTLSDELAATTSTSDDDMIIIGTGGEFALGAGNDEESVNYVNSNGIYRYTLGETLVEQLVNGSLNSISSPEYSFNKIVATDDNSYLLLVTDDSGTYKLLKYAYSAEADATPSTEIKAYSLYDNANIRQAITSYQKANPDVYVSLEIGVADDSGVTANDALKTLNTNIMAGKGPDILILDGMPIDSYIEKGLLSDISDVLQEVSDTDGVFENIANIYQSNDKTYAIPTKFTIPVIVGDKETLDAANDLTALANAAAALREENPDKSGILNFTDASELLDALYPSSSFTWLKEDGTLDEAGLKEFLEQAKKIYDTYIPKQSDENTLRSVGISSSGGNISSIVDEVTSMLMESNSIGLFNITSIDDLSMIISLANSLENSTYDFLKGQSDSVFIPTATVGISAKSENVDAAKAFVKTLLSEEIQKSTVAEGLPINKKAFDELCINSAETESDSNGSISIQSEMGSVNLNITWPTDEQITEFKEKIEALTQASNTNVTICEVVLDEALRCLEGDVSVDEATSNIMTKINLYLSE